MRAAALTFSSMRNSPSALNTLSLRMKRYSGSLLMPQGPSPASSMRYKAARPGKHHMMTGQEYTGG